MTAIVTDEKQLQAPLLGGAPSSLPRPPHHQRNSSRQRLWRVLRPLIAIWALSSLLYCCASNLIRLGNYGVEISNRHSALPKHHERLLKYDGEHISWKTCGTVADRDVECSTIDVPMDQFNASNNANGQHFSIPLIRMRGKNATRSILLNPGGPGGSGSNFLYRKGAQLNTIIGEGFHLLSFDPRGINESRPAASCYPDPPARHDFSAVRDKKVVEDSGELWAWTANYVRSCADTMGEYAPHINTPQTAADMNSILDAIGQPELYYWGFSYGTLLGQTYATLFPDRARRVIIDGVANQFDWYDHPLDLEELTDTDAVFAGFLDECLKAGPGNCSLASLASSKDELSHNLIAAVAKLRDEPVPVYLNSTAHGVLDFWAVWHDGIFPALYKPANWPELATNLASLLQGNATAAFLSYAFDRNAWNESSDAFRFVSLNDGVSGPAHWPKDRLGLVAKLLPHFNSTSMFGDNELSHYFAKQAWPIPRSHGFVPQNGVQTVHPLLILSTTYDPVCPLVSARSAHKAFEGSKLVEVKGYGHCSLAVPSVCIARYVREFLYEGRLPEEDHVQCEVDGEPYFVKPDEGGKVVPTVVFEGEEERRIHLAQLELARDLDWGFRRW
ncbi:Alpha/Beta hydrolase protein [Bombardia bombarda]|uniref:Alpha/Beta hydrolase protein n=1 Tax=Bombardia bombarda TaxID=252184 RepID=A0AA39X134_9PEZI|nr:Alpha/Beta hydrolase protein [Bombardia bombarda]